MIKEYRIWVTGRELKTNLQFHSKHSQWIGTMKFINEEHPKWEMIIIYDKKTNEEKKRYYNYDNKKTFPSSSNEI